MRSYQYSPQAALLLGVGLLQLFQAEASRRTRLREASLAEGSGHSKVGWQGVRGGDRGDWRRRVAVVGASTAAGSGSVPFSKFLPDTYNVQNFAVIGSTVVKGGMWNGQRRAYWTQPEFRLAREFNPDVLIMQFGNNDAKPENWDRAKYIQEFKDLFQVFRGSNHELKLIVTSTTPFLDTPGVGKEAQAKLFDAQKVIASELAVPFVDIYTMFDEQCPVQAGKECFYLRCTPSDNFSCCRCSSLFADKWHPTPRGQKMIAEKIELTLSSIKTPLQSSLPAIEKIEQPPSQRPQIRENCLPGVLDNVRTAGLAMVLCIVIVSFIVFWLASRSVMIGGGLRPSSGLSKIEALDGMRVLLVSFTILYHVHKSIAPEFLKHIFRVGRWPLQYFFVLMGFVNFRVHAHIEHMTLGNALASVSLRMARLCPSYYLALVWLFGLSILGSVATYPLLAWPAQACFLQVFVPMKVCGIVEVDPHWKGANYLQYSANYAGWFTAAAVWCALCFPIMYNWRPRRGWHQTTLILISVLIIRSTPTFTFTYWPKYGSGLDMSAFVLLRMIEYAAGMIFASLANEMPHTCKHWGGWGCVSDACLIVAALTICACGYASHEASWLPHEGPPHGDFLLTGVWGMHVLSCSITNDNGCAGYIDSVISHKWLTWWADYSFGAYILQVPVHYSFTFAVGTLGKSWWIVHLIACWGASLVSTHFIEYPLVRALKRELVCPVAER